MSYSTEVNHLQQVIGTKSGTWDGINAESVARMRLQNRFQTGLDIARYTARIMREDMAAYDRDSSQYTQSLGCWHGFIAQQKMISIKKHFGTTKRKYLYLSGWMVAALRSDFGPLPDQSMHEKTSVPALIEELYTFLRQADAANSACSSATSTPRAPPATAPRKRPFWVRWKATRRTSSPSSPTSTPVSAMPRRPISSPER